MITYLLVAQFFNYIIITFRTATPKLSKYWHRRCPVFAKTVTNT